MAELGPDGPELPPRGGARTRASSGSGRSSASASSPATTRPTSGRPTRTRRPSSSPGMLGDGRRGPGQGLALGRARGFTDALRRPGRRTRLMRAGRAGRDRRDRLRRDRPRRGADRRDGGDADHDLPRPEVHRVPAGAGVRPADPRGGTAGAPREGGHADDGRADPLPRDRGPLPGALRARHREPRGLRGRARLRGARLRRRLHQDHQAPLARALGALQAARPDRARAGALVGRLRAARARPGARVADLRHRDLHRPGALPALRLPGDRRGLERRQPHRRARRARRGLLRDRPARLHGDHDHQRPGRPGAARRLLRRRLDRLPLVQRLPGLDLHGRHRLARAWAARSAPSR